MASPASPSKMPELADGRLEEELPDRKPLMNAHEALAEANRCLYCVDAPCIPSCPTAIDIPEFIRQIATGNVEGSARTILDSNILGYSCARVCPVEVLCESTCVYNELDEKPIKIGKLQRYATEQVYDEGVHFYEAGPDNGKSVALIGAGPASLACAHELRRLGYACTIYEGRPAPGGLNTTGVAPYKLQASDSLREFEYVTAIGGIDVIYDTLVGEDVSLGELENEYDAVFVGVGLGPDGSLGADGEDLDGVIGAVEWIEQMKLDPGYSLPAGLRSVAIVGGGNTAIDVVREMCGLGVQDVMLVYRRNEDGMSGYAHEWKEAKVEGARGVWHTQPVEVLGDGGKVSGLACVRTQVVDGRVELVDDSRYVLPCQMVVLAIGQSRLGSMFADVDGITTDRGKLVVDPETGRAGDTMYFGGGDCVNGGKEVVNASAEGKRAAHGIHNMLSDG